MKNILILTISILSLFSCKNKSADLKTNSIEKKVITTDNIFFTFKLADIDGDHKKDTISLFKKENEDRIEFNIILDNGIKFNNNKLVNFGNRYSNEQLQDYLFLDIIDGEISIFATIGINDRLQYDLIYDKETNNIIIKSLLYSFVSVQEQSYEQILSENIPLDQFNINDYYPGKIKNPNK